MTYPLVEKLKQDYMKQEGKWFTHRWHYIESCILKAYLDSYELTGDEREYQFAKDFIDRLYNDKGEIEQIDTQYYNIDQIRMANVLFTLFNREGDLKYKKVLDTLYTQLQTYPRTKSGNFWHKTNYENQIWLDGLYMGQPFYVRYIKEFQDEKDFSDTIEQFKNVRKYLFDDQTNLYVHAYDESRSMFWCNKETGHSPHVWSRAVGWYAMALVDVLELLEGEDVDSDELKILLKETIDGMLPYQQPNGMWYQVVEHPGEKGNYLETSGTTMMAYALLKAVRLEYLSKDYEKYGVAAFNGTAETYMREEDGEVYLGGICRSAGLGKHPELGRIRDGSYDYYVRGEKVVDNNGHGVAPLLMAYNEINRLK